MRIHFSIVLLFFCFSSVSQEKKEFHPVITIRTNPFSFLETDAGATLGIGYQFHPRWSVGIDPMLIFYSPYKINNGYPDEKEPINGYKIRGEIKYYFWDYIYGSRRGFRGSGFIGLELHYKKTTARKWDSFGMNCINGQCDFYKRAQYTEEKTEEGIAVKAGMIRRLWSPRWAIELYTGVGFKTKHTRQTNLPSGGSFREDRTESFPIFRENGAYPILPTGIKLVYRIF